MSTLKPAIIAALNEYTNGSADAMPTLEAVIEKHVGPLLAPLLPATIPPHVIDTFISFTLKELGCEPFVVLPEKRVEYLAQIMRGLHIALKDAEDYNQRANRALDELAEVKKERDAAIARAEKAEGERDAARLMVDEEHKRGVNALMELGRVNKELEETRVSLNQYIDRNIGNYTRAEALAKFKAYVHKRLDSAGVPTFDDGRECRIGARLDWVQAKAGPLPFDGPVQHILGLMCFQIAGVAQRLREKGATIARGAEAEQAAALHFMLNVYREHGDQWGKAAAEILRSSDPVSFPLPRNAVALEPTGEAEPVKWERAEVCIWKRDPAHEAWDTACGQKHQFTNDGPKENGAEYCCYCGKVLEAVS